MGSEALYGNPGGKPSAWSARKKPAPIRPTS
jgi:hypothetical protein